MADFASLIYGTAQNVAQSQGQGLAEAYMKGSELALAREQTQQKREQLDSQRQEVQSQKAIKLYEHLEKVKNFKNAGDRNNYLKQALGYRNLLGIPSDQVPDESILALSSDENMGRMYTLGLMVERGELSALEASDLAYNPAKRAEFSVVVPTPPELMGAATDLSQSQKEALDRQSKERSAALSAGQRNERMQTQQDQFKQNQKTKLADKINQLGIPGLKAAFTELDSALPGGLDSWKPGQKIPGVSGGEGALPINRLSGDSNKVRGAAQSLVNQLLKLRSGGAVSSDEATRIMGELGMVPVIGEGGSWIGTAFKGITSEASFVNGMKRARSLIQSTEQVYKNAYGNDVYAEVMGPEKAQKSSSVPKSGKVKFNGIEWDRDRLKALILSNPNDPMSKQAKKALGE